MNEYLCEECGKIVRIPGSKDKIYHMSFAYSHVSRIYQLCNKCYDKNIMEWDKKVKKYRDMEYDLKTKKSNTNNDKLNIQKEIYGILSGKVGRIDDPSVEKALIHIEKALTKIQDYINKE